MSGRQPASQRDTAVESVSMESEPPVGTFVSLICSGESSAVYIHTLFQGFFAGCASCTAHYVFTEQCLPARE
ncbi:unnamed protein product [Danaus chrysippus]|uniref:(African queen) hypothetical protein n=1 Tax=Danaus chrysippus TaxID=151541 RepID=A0A8J2VU50_9NEOP|nr:unnamed protein product [Danaus chrysippus]